MVQDLRESAVHPGTWWGGDDFREPVFLPELTYAVDGRHGVQTRQPSAGGGRMCLLTRALRA